MGCTPSKDSWSPTHFVLFKITNGEIIKKVRCCQERMIDEIHGKDDRKAYRETLIPLDDLHCTLCVMELNTPEDVCTAKCALQSAFDKVKDDFIKHPLEIEVKGVGTFGDKVLYAKLDKSDQIEKVKELAKAIQTEMEINGITGDKKAYSPHISLACVSKSNTLKEKGITTFPPEMWSCEESTEFGTQSLDGIEMFARRMGKSKVFESIVRFDFKK